MRAVRIAERIVEAFGRAAAGLLLVAAIGQMAVLIARKFGIATVAAQESVVVAGVFAVLLAIPWALAHERHVAVDMLAWPGARRVGRVFALVLGLTLLVLSAPYAFSAFHAGEGSSQASGIAWRWVAKAAVPLFAALLALQAAALIARRR